MSSTIDLLIVQQPTERPTNPTTNGPSAPATHLPNQYHEYREIIEELDHLIFEHAIAWHYNPNLSTMQATSFKLVINLGELNKQPYQLEEVET